MGYGIESFGKVDQKTPYKFIVGKESGCMMENIGKASCGRTSGTEGKLVRKHVDWY